MSFAMAAIQRCALPAPTRASPKLHGGLASLLARTLPRTFLCFDVLRNSNRPEAAAMQQALRTTCSATIDKLRKDNESLKEELFLENKFSVTPTDNIAAHRIACLQDEADALTRKVLPPFYPVLPWYSPLRLLVVVVRPGCIREWRGGGEAGPARSKVWWWGVQVQLEQRKVALAEMESKQLAEKLGSHQEVIKLAGGFSSATDRAVALHKEIKRRESRRQQASIKFNEAVTHCRKLRTQIDSLRRERLVFDGLHGKLDRDVQVLFVCCLWRCSPGVLGLSALRCLVLPLCMGAALSAVSCAQERKREMAKVIEATNRAAEARERCAAEMAALKAQADREQAAFESEWQRLGAAIDQDRRNRELLRQRDMEERNRKTQEVRFGGPLCSGFSFTRVECSARRDGVRQTRSMAQRRHTGALRARAAAEESRGGADGKGGGKGQGGAARAAAHGRRGEHGPRAAAGRGLPEDPGRHRHHGAPYHMPTLPLFPRHPIISHTLSAV